MFTHDQTALTRAQPVTQSDAYDREADHLADQVSHGPYPGSPDHATPLAVAGRPGPSTLLGSSGQPLAGSVRAYAQSHLGFDFSQVRVHDGAVAAESARAFGANAYTHGHHIVFGERGLRPDTPAGRRLLAHELVHVVQQTAPMATTSRDREIVPRLRLATPAIQCDLALKPPRPAAAARALSEAEMTAAITFNERVIGNAGVGVLSVVRDVLGVSKRPEVVDEDFVYAVVRWQAVNALTQDGRLGAGTATPLFREIAAEGVGRGSVKTGPRYRPSGTIAAATAAGRKSATFTFSAEFENDPANGIFPSCCEVRQFIQWNPAAVASWGGPATVPHGGFPAGAAANTWIEDRDAAGFRYGHRSGQFSDPSNIDQYLDTTGRQNQAFGHIYRGSDTPSGPVTDAGTWRFRVEVVDVANGGRRIGGQDFVRVNW